MSNHTRTLLIVVLMVVFCFAAVSATETAEERKVTTRTSTVTTVTQADPANPTLPTGTPVAPEAGEQINWWVIGAGGGTGSSTGFILAGTVGQTSTDFGSSPSFQLQGGFWQDLSSGNESCCEGRVGDANGQGTDEPTIGDVSVMIDAKFITGVCVEDDGLPTENRIIECLDEADINQSGGLEVDCSHITIGDMSILIDYLFITGSTLGLAECL